ncbi:MAG: hypothetical protein JW981_04360 [Anaerolineae bacterium]|nr:hypothetical protein [Anaerolineae bacterium]
MSALGKLKGKLSKVKKRQQVRYRNYAADVVSVKLEQIERTKKQGES